MNNPTPLYWHNGSFHSQAEAHLPLNDAGFVWGATVTDLCRTVRHRLYCWEKHMSRFRQSCRAVKIYPPVPEDEITELAHQLVQHNVRFLQPEHDLALVLIATPGPIGYYTGDRQSNSENTFIMHTFPLPFFRYLPFFQEGVRLATPAIRHVSAEWIDPRIKQRSRMHWWMADRDAKEIDPQAFALLLDRDGCVTETAAANILLVQNDVVYSPLEGQILEGISLSTVREICGALGIAFERRRLRMFDCRNADEAFIASTPFCCAGVSHINNQPLAWPGPVFEQILQAWSSDIGLDIREQVLADGL